MLELDGDFFGRKKECVVVGISGRGPPGAHEVGGAPNGVGRALDPRGQVLAPPVVFSVPDILKYSRKNHFSISGHLENFYFRGTSLPDAKTENRENQTKSIIFLLSNRK